MTKFNTIQQLGTDRNRNTVEIVKFYGGDAARQRAERDAAATPPCTVATIDDLQWKFKPPFTTVPGTTVPITHVLIRELNGRGRR